MRECVGGAPISLHLHDVRIAKRMEMELSISWGGEWHGFSIWADNVHGCFTSFEGFSFGPASITLVECRYNMRNIVSLLHGHGDVSLVLHDFVTYDIRRNAKNFRLRLFWKINWCNHAYAYSSFIVSWLELSTRRNVFVLLMTPQIDLRAWRNVIYT